MNPTTVLADLRLNAERIIRMLTPEFDMEPGEDVDIDDSFRTSAKELAQNFQELDRQMRNSHVPDSWKPKPGPAVVAAPAEPTSHEGKVAALRLKAKNLGYRLVLNPPTSRKADGEKD
jgi:hypothetical protein